MFSFNLVDCGRRQLCPWRESYFSPGDGVGCCSIAMFYVLRGINGKINQTDLSTKKRFANAIKLFLYGICPDGFVLSMKKRGLEKVTKRTMKSEKQYCRLVMGGHIQNHPKKRFTNVIKLFLQRSYGRYKNHWVIHRNILKNIP